MSEATHTVESVFLETHRAEILCGYTDDRTTAELGEWVICDKCSAELKIVAKTMVRDADGTTIETRYK